MTNGTAPTGDDLAYDAALRALQLQDNTLSNMRTRSGTLLSATALGTAFATAANRIHGTNVATPGLLLAITSIIFLAIIGTLSLSIVWPIRKRTRGIFFWKKRDGWLFGPDINRLKGITSGEAAKAAELEYLKLGLASNAKTIKSRARFYSWSIVLLVVQFGILVALSIVR